MPALVGVHVIKALTYGNFGPACQENQKVSHHQASSRREELKDKVDLAFVAALVERINVNDSR